ncbi:MAG: glycosyltransferase family 39 protein, partial [Gemmatimonadota bacterium]|nr:glycosyltransferase family 39 protein [Gemmatimonadota bacterium]
MMPTSLLRTALRHGEVRTALVVGLLAAVVYLPGFRWGAPFATHTYLTHSWGVDDETPLGPLAEMHNILDPKPDRSLGYPLMHPFLVAAAYAPYMAVLVASGQMESREPVYPYGLADPVRVLRTLSGIAHLVSVLMGVTAVVAAFFAGLWYHDRPTGLVSAAVAMTAFPMLYYARTGNVDMTMLAFSGLGVATYCWCLRNRFTVRAVLWLGVWTGLAIATKEAAFGIFALMPAVLLRRTPDPRTRWTASIAGLGASILAFGFGSGLFVEPGRYIAHVKFIAGKVETVATDPQWVVQAFPFTLAGHVGLARLQLGYLVDALTLPGLCLVLAAVVWIVGWRRRHVPLLVPAVGYAA